MSQETSIAPPATATKMHSAAFASCSTQQVDHGGDVVVKRSSSRLDGDNVTIAYLLKDEGIEWFLREAYGRLLRLVPRGYNDLAWDAVVDAVMAVRRAPERFQRVAKVFAYARAVLEHSAARRRLSWAKCAPFDSACDWSGHADAEASAIDRVDFRRVLRCLPSQLQHVIIARSVLGQTTSEVAVLAGTAEQTISNRHHKAKVLARGILRERAAA